MVQNPKRSEVCHKHIRKLNLLPYQLAVVGGALPPFFGAHATYVIYMVVVAVGPRHSASPGAERPSVATRALEVYIARLAPLSPATPLIIRNFLPISLSPSLTRKRGPYQDCDMYLSTNKIDNPLSGAYAASPAKYMVYGKGLLRILPISASFLYT